MTSARSCRIRSEQLILQALCQGTQEGSIRETAALLLRDYVWQEPLYRVIYEVLLSIHGDNPIVIREQLPSRLTLKGFPDAPWEELFDPQDISKSEVEQLMQDLKVE